MTDQYKKLNLTLAQCIARHFLGKFQLSDLTDPSLKIAFDYWAEQV